MAIEATLAAQHASMTNDTEEESVDEVDEQEEVRLANTPVPVVSKSFVAASTGWITVELLFEDGSSVANQAYVITDASDAKHTGNTDENGCANLENIAQGACDIEFTNLEGWR